MWGELSSEWGELSSECGASCLGRIFFGASCLGASCLWGELSVIREMMMIYVSSPCTEDYGQLALKTTRPKESSRYDKSQT